MLNPKQHQGMSVEAVQIIVDEFLAEYNGHIPVTALIRQTQEELYGDAASREKIGYRIDGAYHPARHIITLAAANMGDKGAVQRTLRHELLGHYGLNTFKPHEKRALLDSVLDTRKEASLKPSWDRVDRDYAMLNDLQKAEEVFAFVAENRRYFIDRAWDKVCELFQKILRAMGLSDRKLTVAELHETARKVAQGIRNGSEFSKRFHTVIKSNFG
jgi:hypothetical protein